ncbi:MAG: hypothetical protein C4288_22275 [Leptolyngbya sp. ERB_1_1]
MTDSLKDRLKTDLQNIKAEGGTRTTRIREIIQAAATQSMTELKEGIGEIRSTASQSVSSITQTLNDPETEGSEAPSTAFNSTRTRLMSQLRGQLFNLDAKLAARYGDRYETVKHRLGLFQVWYDNSKANAEIVGITPVQQKQTEIELKIANQGAFVARKEQQIRQQVKELLSTTISKR